jgi:RNA polymerase sigma factor for flagellar operon FliA
MSMPNRDPRLPNLLSKVRAVALAIGRLTPGDRGADDLISAGYLGVAQAMSRQQGEPTGGFEAYCLAHARGAILDELRRRDIVGRRDRRRVRQAAVATRVLRNRLGREPDEGEIAAEMKLDLARYRLLRERVAYAAVGGGSFETDCPCADMLCDERESAEQVMEKGQRSAVVARFLHQAKPFLSTRQAETIELSFVAEQPSVSIARRLGVSEARVSQLRKTALARLREMGSANDALCQEAG